MCNILISEQYDFQDEVSTSNAVYKLIQFMKHGITNTILLAFSVT